MGNTPWAKLDKVKWLCPVPGYDRHFAICEYFDIEMISIPMNEDGPDMDMIEDLISKDESIKGIWCVPKYANPNGITYSNEVVKRFANLKPKAKDFRIFWDNAYSVHHLYEDKKAHILEIVEECEKANNPDLVYKFSSTSKISFPGSGIAALATSLNNIKDIEAWLTKQTIGHDKLNELRHARYFKDIEGIKAQMKRHAEILKPKFDIIDKTLSEDVIEGFASWNKPLGGYFISLECNKGVAKEVVSLCKEVGLILTAAGSSFPYHKDPNNSNIRIAPSFPTVEDLKIASKILALAVNIESIKKLLANY
jgi:DNA-binding transcriptional MocR family regulator